MAFKTGLILGFVLLPAVALAQAPPDSENGRYTFSPVADGVVRLDTRTGQVSHCRRGDTGWACQVVPDERAALESEIARLQKEAATLKKELLALGAPLPGLRPPEPSPELRLPSDADIDRVMSFMEKVWRRLWSIVQGTPKEPPSKI